MELTLKQRFRKFIGLPPMSLLSILDETLDYYNTDPERRGVKKRLDCPGNNCFYTLEKFIGIKTCAIGRCMTQNTLNAILLDPEINADSINTLPNQLNISLDDMLLPQYRGHSSTFWIILQTFHDADENWGTIGITGRGLENYRKIRRDILK